MNYQRIYDSLVKKAQSREKPDCYTEAHHIVPRSFGGSNDKSNLVDLTAREHCLAHLLLAKIHGGKMWHAANMMAGVHRMKSRAYAEVRERHAKEVSKQKTGKKRAPFSKEWIENMSKAQRGENNSMYGKERRDMRERTGDKNFNFKYKVEATNIKTGETQIFIGKRALTNAGFSQSASWRCMNGKQKIHLNHTFKRIEA
jgi:hypothetical protein